MTDLVFSDPIPNARYHDPVQSVHLYSMSGSEQTVVKDQIPVEDLTEILMTGTHRAAPLERPLR